MPPRVARGRIGSHRRAKQTPKPNGSAGDEVKVRVASGRPRDDKWLVIAANQDQLFRRLSIAMGRPELADDPRYATHLARGEHQVELDAIIQEWAKQHLATEIDELLNEAGVVCGPIYTVADMFQDEHFKAREMLLEAVDPDFGPYIGPGIIPKFSETPGAVRWSATWEPGSHNEEVLCDLLGLARDELPVLKEQGVI